ncbi:MAG: hypothetical protein K1X91_10980 [Bacteriodetes bacterium]|nr:hypothetical protein [Bacteroidota bacterium]
MNSDEINILITDVDTLLKYNFVKRFSEYKNSNNVDNVELDIHSPEVIFNILEKTLESFKKQFNTNRFIILPPHYSYNGDQYNIVTDWSNVKQRIESNIYDSALANLVKRVAFYSIDFSFESSSDLHIQKSILDDNVRKTNHLIQELIDTIKSSQKNINLLSEKQTEYDKFIQEAKNTLEEVKENKNRSQKFLDDINIYNIEATRITSDMKNIQTQLDELLDEFDEELKQRTISLQNTQSLIDEKQEKIQTQEELMKKSNASLTDARLDYQELFEAFQQKKTDIENLLNFAVGTSLSTKYEKQSEKYSQHIFYWMGGIIVMMIITVYFISMFVQQGNEVITQQIELLKNGKTILIEPWQILLYTSLKSLPFIVILVFIIKQFSNTIKIRDEYGFKSSIALTMEQHSKMIHPQNDNLNSVNERNEILKSALVEIYRNPVEENSQQATDNLKIITNTLRELPESIKSIINR